MPSPSNPDIEEWLEILDNLKPDKDTILAGHSRGGVAVLRYLERTSGKLKIKKVILLATNSGSAKFMAIPNESNKGFYTKKGYNFKKIKSHCDDFVVFHSEDDPWVPFEHGEENVKGLDAKFIKFKDKKHFGKNEGIVPGLIDEVIEEK